MPPALVCLALAAAVTTACASDAYVVTRHLVYDPAIGLHGTFDMYEPPAETGQRSGAEMGAPAATDRSQPAPPELHLADRPAILAIHGGAWRGGDKAWGSGIAEEFAPHGYVVFAINYRLAGRPGGTWPAQIEDVQSALKHIRTNARQYGIDPSRIASLGMSAGGHLATMVALRDDPANPDNRVDVAVNLNGEHDMTMSPDRVMADFDDIMATVLGHERPWSDAELRDISTVTFARPDVAVLTVHGAGDDNVYVEQGDRITEVLRAAGAVTEYVRLEGRAGNCHSDCWKEPSALTAIHRFLDHHLSHDGRKQGT